MEMQLTLSFTGEPLQARICEPARESVQPSLVLFNGRNTIRMRCSPALLRRIHEAISAYERLRRAKQAERAAEINRRWSEVNV